MLSRRLIKVGEEKPIVQDGLKFYLNSRRVDGSTWTNIAPETLGKHNSTIYGVTPTPEGMYFNGVNNYASIKTEFSASGLNIDSPFTFELWIKRQSASTLYVFGTASASAGRLMISADGVTTLYHGTSSLATSTTPILALDALCHLVYTYDPSTDIYNYYLNGKFFKSGSQPNNYTLFTNNAWTIGTALSQNYFKGFLPVFRLYSKALTLEEINKNFDAKLGIGI